MKICAISDLHGYLPRLDPCDLVLICGDIVPLEKQVLFQEGYKWYSNEFKSWVDSLPCDKVLFILGNHELCVQLHEEDWLDLFPTYEKATLLFDEEYIYETEEKEYRIYGTPWCKQFGNWAYMANSEQLTDLYSQIPEGLDILMTHDAPYGVSDVLLQKDCPWADGTHIGNMPLAECIKLRKPRYVCHGHLHSTSRQFESLEGSLIINCSLKDEFYKVVYSPIYFTI